MEGKGAAAAVALFCILILLSGEQLHQVAAMSKFCRCYLQCYPDCRKSLPRFICVLKCIDDCSPNKKRMAVGDCNKFCLLAICGMALNGQADVASCVDDCTKNPNLHTKFL
uniref:Acidic protein n=1 Tax=Oryza nivara TaxID=4536 RepID=A0A0E0G069_ORYNI